MKPVIKNILPDASFLLWNMVLQLLSSNIASSFLLVSDVVPHIVVVLGSVILCYFVGAFSIFYWARCVILVCLWNLLYPHILLHHSRQVWMQRPWYIWVVALAITGFSKRTMTLLRWRAFILRILLNNCRSRVHLLA